LDNCTKCHVLGNKVTNVKCLECHTEINEKIKSGSGLHSNIRIKGKECIACHNEHHGRNFKLIKFDKNSFNHSETGFTLQGKHTNIKCEECHNIKNQVIVIRNKRQGTYLGLNQNCSSCHEDYHQGTLSSDCQKCHNNEAFRPASFFNHNNTAFTLSGAHLRLNCTKCHHEEIRNGRKFTKFKGIDFKSCTSCHQDVHQGKFGSNCQKCHSTESFKNITTAKFNHSLTNFPLTGKHLSLECIACHKSGLQVKLKYNRCSDCHEDFHRGEFTVANTITDCSQCHNFDGFRPAIYTVEDHNKSRFILAGSHLALPCSACHNNEGIWKFKFAEVNCVVCHKNIHEGEISDKYINKSCESCHKENSWHNITFDHKLTGFILEGKHAGLLCSSCHANKTDNKIKYVFKTIGHDCESCHKDIHSGQFKIDGKSDCSRCHIPESWKSSKFDHNNTGFPLTGAHKNLECSRCHLPVLAANNISYMVYKIGKLKCSDCHKL
jgi:hypothetical protein